MYLSQTVLIKYNEKIVEGKVVKIYDEELDIKLDDGEIVRKKYWEIRSVPIEKE